MAYAFFLGVDVAPDREGWALTLLEKEDGEATTYRLHTTEQHDTPPAPDDLAEHVQDLVTEGPYIGRTTLVVNCTNEAGDALADALDNRGLDPVRATLTGGTGATAGDTDETGVTVAERTAVETLLAVHHDGRLALDHHASKAASRLVQGLQSYASADKDGDGQTPSRPEAHDMHVTSAALACWLGSERSFDPTQHLKEDIQTAGAADTGSASGSDAGAESAPDEAP